MTQPEPSPTRHPREVRLPRWRRIALLLAPLDLLLVGWAIVLHVHPARIPALVLVGAAFLCFLAFLIQCFAWVTVIAFFARERAREGIFAAALLLLQLASLLAVLWLAGPALAT
jgi:hypothetical protein